MRALLRSFVIILLAFAGTACTNATESEPVPDGLQPAPTMNQAEERVIRLGFTMLGEFEFPVAIKKELEQEIKARSHIELIAYEGKASGDQQIADVADMIDKNVDVIILNPVDAVKSTEAVELAVAAGIPVIGINTIPDTDLLTSYVGSNDIEAGEIEMQFMAETLGGKGDIVILQGLPEQSSQIERTRGIFNVLKDYPDLRVLEMEPAQWSRDEGYRLMKEWYEKHGDRIGGVVSQNDEMALGAAAYLREIGKPGHIPVIGVDALDDALKAVKNGEMAATVFQDAVGQAKLAVNLAESIARDGQAAKSYFIPYRLVTPENVDYFLK